MLSSVFKSIWSQIGLAACLVGMSHMSCAQYGTSDSTAYYYSQALQQNNTLDRLALLQRALEWSLRSEHNASEIQIHYQIGLSYEQLQQWGKATSAYEKCIKRANKLTVQEESDVQTKFEAVYQLAQIEIQKGHGLQCIKILNSLPSKDLEIIFPIRKNAYNRLLARGHMQIHEYSQAMAILVQQHQWELANDDYFGMVPTLLQMGEVSQQQNNNTLAEAKYLEALDIATKLKDELLVSQCNEKLAQNYRLQDKLEPELFYRNNNIQYNTSNANSLGVIQEKAEIVSAYIDSDNLAEAEKVISDNEIFSMNTLTATNSLNTNDLQTVQFKAEVMQENADSYKALAKAFDGQNNYKQAIANYKKYMAFQDSVNALRQQELELALESNTLLSVNEERIGLLEKDREINEQKILLLEQEKSNSAKQVFSRNLIIGLLSLCLIAGILGAYYFLRLSRSRQRANQLVTLQSLTGQMNPHFIFNALNSVNEYIGHNDERAANRYLSSFSKLMRQVLDDSRKPFIAIQEEIDMLQLYLKLEHARFEDRFNYRWEIAPGSDLSAYEIPPMLLQPYVENAIWHGLRYRKDKGELVIKVYVHETRLHFHIIDNGIGMAQSKALKTANQKKQKSLAMQNTSLRIALIQQVYGYAIQLEQRVPFDHDNYPGNEIHLALPLHFPQSTSL
jgi:hypothetical protein